MFYLKTCDPKIKFTCEMSQDKVHFLDTTVSFIGQQMLTDLYCKPTNAHNYLLYSSAHPQKCRDSICYSQVLHIRWMCSRLINFDNEVHEVNGRIKFLDRRYPIHFLKKTSLKARKANWHEPHHLTWSYPNTENNRSILVTTLHPEDKSPIHSQSQLGPST